MAKKTTTFKRGLDQDFVDKLNCMYNESNSWWRNFMDHKELFLAIRNDAINVYYRGNSLLKLNWNKGEISGEIHYKYLLKPQESEYIRIDPKYGRICLSEPRCLFMDDLTNNIDEIKIAAKPYASPEKEGVYDIVLANPNILDLEIAFGTSRNDEKDRAAPRVDFAALQPDGQNIKIVFFEAKQFTNQELRASGRNPKVINQIMKYTRLLEENCEKIRKSYQTVCRNFRDLQGSNKKCSMIESIANKPEMLRVDTNPRLVVFGYDRDQETGKVWEKHRKVLQEKLGKSQVLLKGHSKQFTKGISPLK